MLIKKGLGALEPTVFNTDTGRKKHCELISHLCYNYSCLLVSRCLQKLYKLRRLV